MVQYKQFLIRPSDERDIDDMSRLSASVLGPGRFARTAYRLRERTSPNTIQAFNAYKDDELAGTVSLTPLVIGGQSGAFLLGPLIVDEAHRGHKLGAFLINHCKEILQSQGAELMILVGDLSYYGRTGFQQVPLGAMQFPGPIDYSRLLALELKEGVLPHYCGLVGV